MTITDKIADIIYNGGVLTSYQDCADTIMAALPDYEAQQARITELEAALRSIEKFRVGPIGQTVAERVMRELAAKALKGETK
jgi:hypothetical protein